MLLITLTVRKAPHALAAYPPHAPMGQRSVAARLVVALIALVAVFVSCAGPSPAMTPAPMSLRDYDTATTEIEAKLTRAMNQLGPLISSPAYADPAWQGRLSSAGAALVTTYQEARSTTPPICFRDTHPRLLVSLELFALGGKALVNGIGQAGGDADRMYPTLEAASTALNTATTSYRAVAQEMNDRQCTS